MTIVAAPDNEFQWFTAHLGHYSLTVIAVLSVFLVITRIIEGSEKIAKYVPIVGRALRARGERREQKAAERVTEAVIAQIEPPDYAAKVDRLEERIDALEQRDDVASAWRIFDSLWHEEDEMERIEKGHPIKPRLTYRDFAAKYYAGERYFNGVWTKI